MPTFKICVFEHHQRKDGRYRVSIRVTHNRKTAYLATDTYVLRKQIASDFSYIKDTDITRKIDRDILNYEKILLSELGSNLDRFSTKELINYISKHSATEGGANIDFIAFSQGYTTKLTANGHAGYSIRFNAVIRALIDFFKRDQVFIKEINSKNLKEFAEFLSTEREMTRINQLGKKYNITRKAVKTQTVADYLRIIQTLFNAACEEYNSENEETALITHNPFRKQLIKVTDSPEKRNLSVADLIKIIKYDTGMGREGLARDVFLISFYLIGMNTADIFNTPASALADGRLTYKRQKTATRRRDEALISIKIEPEVEKLLKQYRDPNKKRVFRFYHKYADHRSFNSNLNRVENTAKLTQ